MHIRSDSFKPFEMLSGELAFCVPADEGHARLGPNRNPHLAWSDVPEGARSLVLLCYDTEVPSEGTHVNKEGESVPLYLPRVDFFHWVTCDLPADLREIEEGSHAAGVVARGKQPGPTPSGGLQGVNDYTGWFASDPEMAGAYGGYDGPCPPWNDERVHAYVFAVYALDVASLGLSGAFTGAQVREAMAGHVLDSARIIGLYTLNPAVRDAAVAAALRV